MVANRHIKLFLFVGQDQEQHPAVHSRGIIREKFCGCGAFIEFDQKGQFHTVLEYRKSKKTHKQLHGHCNLYTQMAKRLVE